MNAVVELKPQNEQALATRGSSTTEIIAHTKRVQEVMRSVMIEGVHYGAIPGAGDKPTLLKSGAEVLCMTFRIADSYRVTDLSSHGVIRYRVECIGTHQESEMVLGSGLGECSSGEEKYKWRKAVCDEEFENTPSDMRRIKYARKHGGHYTVKQVKTEPDDLANTVLKMACKRAKIAMTINVTACGDMFSQDLEDLDAELVRHLTDDERNALIQSARAEWCKAASAAKDAGELRAIMKDGVKVFQAARDTDGYAMFARAVQARGAQLKGNGNA